MTPQLDEEFYRLVMKHNQDLYLGNGRDNPSLCTRMALHEQEMENMKEAAEKIEKNAEKIKYLVIATILAIAGDIIVKLVVH